MKQTLHIFAKDLRHFLPEILISLALVAAFVRTYPSVWRFGGMTIAVAGGYSFSVLLDSVVLAYILLLLLPVTWWLLIARVIHAEPLVGDRQFWLTRPYEWQKLLSAKLLFLLAFLYVPLLTAQCLLLLRAGFPPASFLPGLLYNLLLLTGVFILPLLAITTVTATFARLTLTLLALLACFLGYIVISMAVAESAGIPYNDHLSLPISLALCSAVVGVQYSTRRFRVSLLLLIALPILLVLTGLSVPDAYRIGHAYAAQGAPVHLALLHDDSNPATANLARGDTVQMSIPLQVGGVPEGYAMAPDHVRVTIDGADGRHWTSFWQGVNNQHYLPGESTSAADILVDRAFFDQVQSAPVALHFTFAFTELQAEPAQTLPLSAHNFPVPGFGVCSSRSDDFSRRLFGIACRFPLHQPRLTRISLFWPDPACSASSTDAIGDAWAGNLEDAIADLSIPSVWSTELSLSNATTEKGGKTEVRHLCPGTPVTFTPYHLARRMHYDLTIPDFQLPSYRHAETSLNAEP